MTRRSGNLGREIQSRFLSWGKVCILAGLVVTVFALSLIIGMRFAVRGGEVSAPALVGMSLANAKDLFSQVDLSLQVAGNRYDRYIPKNSIISQVPGAGVRTKVGSSIKVIVSLGPRTRPVPDVRGNSVRAARLLVEQHGYQIGRISELRSPNGNSKVVGQWPPPQSESAEDDRIDILVLTHADEQYLAPDFTGLNLNRVLIFLREEGFKTKVFYRSQSSARKGLVVRQFPEPGYPLSREQVVNLEVAQ